MSSVVDQWTDEVGARILKRLGEKKLPIRPKAVRIGEDTDAFGEDAWRLLLVLPAPEGETWDRASVVKARRAVIEVFDALAAEDDRALPGWTVALVTTDEAAEDDIAVEDAPERDEDPGRKQ